MRINKPVGSKDRLVEIFQKVNHVKLNENLLEMGGVNLNANNVLNMAFSQLQNKKLSVEQSNTQGSGDENFVQLMCIDQQGNNISFVFRAITSEGDQDGVYSLDAAELTEFGFDSADGEESIDLDENGLQQFNSQHADELLNVVEEYVDVEEPSDAGELGEAVKLIDAIKKDSYPYGGGNDRMQTGQNYGDKKPTNDKVRVKSPQLDKFVQETDKPAMKLIQQGPGGSTAGGVKQLDEMDLPIAGMSLGGVVEGEFNDDISGKQAGAEIQPFRAKEYPGMYDELPVDNEPVEEVSPEKRELILQAYDNLLKTKSSPTYQEVMDEIDRITGKKKERTRDNMIPKDFEHLEDLWENQPIKNDGDKNAAIVQAIQNVKKRLGNKFLGLGLEEYKNLVKAEIDTIKQERHLSTGNLGLSMNEEEKGDYPDPIGKKFKPKKHYPKKKQKQDTTVKLGESTDQDRYENVVFLQGDAAFDALERLDLGGNDAALKYLQQWHNPGEHMGSQELGHGSNDRTYEKDGYIMSWNSRLGYIGLQYDLSHLNEEAEPNAQKGIEDIDNPSPGDEVSPEPSVGSMEDLPADATDPANFDINQNAGEELQGGKADGMSGKEFNPEQLSKGLKIEMEHTDDPKMALEIAMDHLAEIPDYYDRLETMEKEAGVGNVEGGKKSSDKELTDTLLGFKPHNVGDELGEQEDVFGRLGDILRPQKPQPEEEPEEEMDEDLGFTPQKNTTLHDLSWGEKFTKDSATFDKWKSLVGELLEKHLGRPQWGEEYNSRLADYYNSGLNVSDARYKELELHNNKTPMPEGLYESQIKLAKETLSNRNVPTGMSKKEATQILVKHLIK